MKKILVIGKHKGMMDAVIGLLEDNDYIAFGTTEKAEALQLFNDNHVDAVILGNGVDQDSRRYYHQYFVEVRPEMVVLDVHESTMLAQLEEVLG